jgi:hypothetical protein
VEENENIILYFCALDGEKVPVEIASNATVTQLRVRMRSHHSPAELLRIRSSRTHLAPVSTIATFTFCMHLLGMYLSNRGVLCLSILRASRPVQSIADAHVVDQAIIMQYCGEAVVDWQTHLETEEQETHEQQHMDKVCVCVRVCVCVCAFFLLCVYYVCLCFCVIGIGMSCCCFLAAYIQRTHSHHTHRTRRQVYAQ